MDQPFTNHSPSPASSESMTGPRTSKDPRARRLAKAPAPGEREIIWSAGEIHGEEWINIWIEMVNKW